MKESDFPQFDDPRVREVMAAAANLVEAVNTQHPLQDVDGPMVWLKKVPLNTARDVCVAALFAAQHSKPPTHEKPKHVCVAYPRAKSILTCCLNVDDIPAITGAAWCEEEKCFHWHVLRGSGMKDILHIETPEEYEELFGAGSCQGKVRESFTAEVLHRVYVRAKNNLFPHEKPVEFDEWGYSKPVTNRFNVDGSKPGGKAFIAAVEEFDSVTGKDARGYTADDYNGRGGPGDR